MTPTASFVSLALIAIGVMAAPARAHFPWLATDAEGHALLFFGESPADRVYREPPEAVAAAKVLVLESGAEGDAAGKEIELAAVESDDFVGRKSEATTPAGATLESTISYGIYHGMLLDYYARHIPSLDAAAPKSGLKLTGTPRATDSGIELTVLWEGKPLADAVVTIIDGEGTPTEEVSDAEGVAKFEAPAPGLIGFLIARTDNDAKGEVDGEKYTSAGAYGTLTVNFGKPAAAAPSVDPAPSVEPAAAAEGEATPTSTTTAAAPTEDSALTPLPEPLSSFGAAVSDGWLYVYGGHTGEEHAHSRDNLSNHFRRIALAEGDDAAKGAWEELPMEIPVQGLPLVAHGGKIYRVGGLSFRNAAADEADMHSVAEFACFDPATQKWTALTPLPEARSSHDAVVIGDTLYVVGGWTLAGESEGDWLGTAWSFDLSDPQAEWQAVASPTFKRRALAAARWNRQLVAIGGMDDNAEISRRVDALDPATGKWTKMPDLPRGQMAGFGVSAWNLDGKLLVSGADGAVLQLSDDGTNWEKVGKLSAGRFFHRLMPGTGESLLVIAGASIETGKHLATVESFSPGSPN